MNYQMAPGSARNIQKKATQPRNIMLFFIKQKHTVASNFQYKDRSLSIIPDSCEIW